ncbi:hypothetical protein [Bilophila wadsworthia]|uniref:hypothetical protein n=1 Tax=Bilophila wadsworthia TaxID=35833 RepID=UPI00351FE782
MLTEQERKWLELRKYRKAPCGAEMHDCVGCLTKYECNLASCWIESAEFEARVSRCIAENASELDMISNNLQFIDGFKAKSLAWYILREARIAVEEEMKE